MKGPLRRYHELVDAGVLADDPAQAAAAERLQTLADDLTNWRAGGRGPFRRRQAPPPGLYLWGAVGRGKSLLMDVFFNNIAFAPRRRVHFHEFMAETHQRIANWRAASERARRRHPGVNRKAPDDPMPPVAADIAAQARLLCFDEFQVSDIADAMILGRLFEALFAQGVVVVATSNRRPDDLYKDGLNRRLFEPFIDLIKTRTEFFELAAAKDYRLDRLSNAKVYHCPLGVDADAEMEEAWARAIAGASPRKESIRIKGRTLVIPKTARGAARFEFADLCERPLGAGDYLTLCRHCDTLFVDNIPRLSADKRNEAKRFVTLIDAIYESRTKLVCSADAAPPELYPDGDGAFEFERTASRLIEMQSTDYLSAERIISTPPPG